MAGYHLSGSSDRIVLSPAGPGAWRALDPTYPPEDARCLLAYVESVGDRYLVLSLVPPLGGVTEVETLADAEAAVQGLREGTRRTASLGARRSKEGPW
jgi:hypothetical protein